MAKRIIAKIKEKPIKTIVIDTPSIRLDAALKLADAVQSGGHAKIIIQSGEVKVNGEECIQRGKKLRPGDRAQTKNLIVEVQGRDESN